jgi:hypothetical protein
MATNYTIAGTLFLRRSNSAALSASFYDSAGVIADPGTVTVTITRQSDGSTVVTGAATTGTGAAARAYTLSAIYTADLDVLTVVWSGTISAAAVTITQECEVIGDWLFTIAEARAAHPDLLEATYPDATIQAIRERITEWFAEICGVSFVERFRRVVVSGDGTAELLLPEAMRVTALRRAEERTSGTQTWTALSAGDLADVLVEPIGLLVRETIGTWTAGRRNWRIGYEHGWEQVPEPIKHAALRVLISQVFPSNHSDRALSETNSLGTFRLAAPDARTWGRWFGLPLVDAVLAEYSERLPGMA